MKSKGLELSTIVGSKKQFLGNLTSFLIPVARDGYHWALCWRASKDGGAPETFHSLCDGKGPTVSIVKVGEYIFGGYTNASWTRPFSELFQFCLELFIITLFSHAVVFFSFP